MSEKRDFEPIARAFMAGGPTQLADRVLERSLADVHQTQQRRPLLRAPWRTTVMNIYAKFAAVAVVVIAVGAVGLWLITPRSSTPAVGGAPTQSASPSAPSEASPTPEPSLSPTPPETVPPLSGTFTSTRYGISLATPEGWTTQPATEAWDGAAFPNYGDPSVDIIYDPVRQGELWLMVASKPLDGADPDQWPADQLAAAECTIPVPLTVDGASGVIGADFSSTDCSVAFVATGGRGYQIRFYQSSGAPGFDRAWFDQVLTTVDLRPEDAVD